MNVLSERLREVEVKEQEFEPATVEEALDFLLDLTEKVESYKMGRVVLATNLLQEGQRGPSTEVGRLIRSFWAREGHRSVSDSIWVEAIEGCLENFGISPDFLFENLKRNVWKEERQIELPKRPDLCLKIIRGYSPRSGHLESLRLELLRKPLHD